ncbi:hypothetical protein HU200_037024 [Digitaria exilis]|uniref:Subtilisin-like protease n=1 Tax=Digitaria exilis TaxID=1010633 RepID=A0A835BFY8_9POAL|nr:hypothetical protein HU200_037024 [Digitaria exilis]
MAQPPRQAEFAVPVPGQGERPSNADVSSPRDYLGHGSHTLSTAGGSFVRNASVFGHGEGTAAGGSPGARVAAYKACYAAGCTDVDVLAAILASVADGVHVLSMSLGPDTARDYLTDLTAIGTFFAVQSGVAVVCSAGNSGPGPGTVSNVAPWIFTVGASTMDRDFPAFVHFGDSLTIQGESLAGSTLPLGQAYPMISAANATAANQTTSNSSLCLPGSLDPAKVAGKIVVCVRGAIARVEKGLVVKQAGGVGMVLCNDPSSGDSVIADPHLIPAAHCSYSQCLKLLDYLKSTESSRLCNVHSHLFVYSSEHRVTDDYLLADVQPDITAPGVSVIAAYTGAISPAELDFDDRRVAYNVMSGTSMACPHVSGVVGLLKTKYPTWTPAMIKSAIMTTGELEHQRYTTLSTRASFVSHIFVRIHICWIAATTVANDDNPIQDETGAEATPFSYGSGHLNPADALDPGLVYDTTLADYTNFLCSLKLTQNPLQNLPVNLPNLPGSVSLPLNLLLPFFNAAGEPCTCSKTGGPYGRPEDMNYPSIAVPCLSGTATVRRRLKNVGGAPGKYRVTVTDPAGVHVTVAPSELEFGIGEEKEFTVKLDVVDAAAAANYAFGSIVWSDAKGFYDYSYGSGGSKPHRVRSPIVVKTKCG